MDQADTDNLDVSVILTTYNRCVALRRTLETLCDLRAPGLRWELAVVDNNSTDRTRDLCAAFADRLPIRYLFEPRQGKNHAVQLGLAHVRGELVVMTDDDVAPEPAWLELLWAAAQRWGDRDIFCGPVITAIPAPFAGTLAGAVPTCNFRPEIGEGLLGEDQMPIGANLAFRRRVLAPSLFDPEIGPKGRRRISGSESVALWTLQQRGHRIVYVPGAVVHHETPAGFRSIGGLCRRAMAQGRGDVRVLRFGAEGPRVLGIPRFVIRLALGSAAGVVAGVLTGERRRALWNLFRTARFLAVAMEWRKLASVETTE